MPIKEYLTEPIVLVNDAEKQTEESLDDLFSQYNESSKTVGEESKPQPKEETKPEDNKTSIRLKDKETRKTVTLSSDAVLDGATVMLLINMFMPKLIMLVHNKFAKGYKPINYNDLKLTKTQTNDLAPLAQKAAESVEIKADPITAFLGGLSGVMLLTYLNVLEKEDKEPNKKENES